MNAENSREYSDKDVPQWDVPQWLARILPVASAVGGMGVLRLAWALYGDKWGVAGFGWYHWIPAALMVVIGLLCLVAAPMLAVGKPAGRSMLWTALSLVPVVLFTRLVIVAFLFLGNMVGWIQTGELFARLPHFIGISRLGTATNIILIVIVIAFGVAATLSKNNKSQPPGEQE